MPAPDPVTAGVRETLTRLDADDRQRFAEEKERSLHEEGLPDGEALEELCCLRVILRGLSEGYDRALARFESRLDERSEMRQGWRKATVRKVSGEYESPMPWLHPFRLAREELEPLEVELREAIARGGASPRALARIEEVLAKHELALPLPDPEVQPRFPPGAKSRN